MEDDESGQQEAMAVEATGGAKLSEEDRLWKVVEQNPADFTSWTHLIAEVEKEPVDIMRVRRAYDRFLAEYPLCFGYFKKYADILRRESDASARKIFELGVVSVPHSVDMWQNYITFAHDTGDATELRKLFHRAIDACGRDLRDGHNLWDKFIDFESQQEEWVAVNDIYTWIMDIPLVTLDGYFERYKHFVFSHPLDAILTVEKQGELEEKLAEAAGDDEEEKSLEAMEGEKKALVIKQRQDKFKQTQVLADARKPFESAVTRPYFHVKALEEGQLENWRQYLDFVEQHGTDTECIKLYERCLVACALYSEFWERYAAYVEKKVTAAKARDIYRRATTIFLKKRPSIHLSHALFEESLGSIAECRHIYDKLIAESPGLLQAVVQYANFERRQKNNKRVEEIYKAGIASSTAKTGAFLTTQYAEFLYLVCGDARRARERYAEGTGHYGDDKTLWLARIDFEAHQPGADVEQRVQALYDVVTGDASLFNDSDKADFLLRNTQFIGDRGSDVRRLLDLKTQYRKTQKKTRKRPNEGGDSGRAAKAARTSQQQTAATGPALVPAAAPAAAGQYNYSGYGSYAPAAAYQWPAQ